MNTKLFGSKYQLLLLLILILVCLPRFDRNDRLLGEMVGSDMDNDSMHYVAMAEIYSGKISNFTPHSPFTYRPLVPFLAALLPLPEMTAINVINVFSMWLASILLASLLLSYQLNRFQTLAILLSFIISFPVFYYGAIGYVDPVVIAILGIGCYFIHRQQDIALIALIFLGTFVKETVILLIPVFITHKLVLRKFDLRVSALTLLLIVAYLLGTGFTRSLSMDQTVVMWTPSWDRFMSNVTRFRTWASLVLTLGIPGAAAVLAIIIVLIDRKWVILSKMLPWIVGLGGSFALFVASVLTAYSDGRFIWPASVFSVLIVAVFVSAYQERFEFLKLG